MYESYFGFREKPFSIAPDPRFVYLSPAHEEALAHLIYGVTEGGGFVLLSGEVGTGKTTLVRTLLEQLPDNVDVAYIFNPRQSPLELLASICDELGIDREGVAESLKELVDLLNRHLLETFSEGRRTVLLVDEAQALRPEVLEQIRLLTNLETTREKLLEIILVGQPELRDTLARADLRQLAQRITARYHLAPLSPKEVDHYVEHRVRIAGGDNTEFNRRAISTLAKASGGVPRLINEIADRSLLGAYASEKRVVTPRLVKRAAEQVLGSEKRQGFRWGWVLGISAAALVLITQSIFALNKAGVDVPGFEYVTRLISKYGEGVFSRPIYPDELKGIDVEQTTAIDSGEDGRGMLAESQPEDPLRLDRILRSAQPGQIPETAREGYRDELTEGAVFSVWMDQEKAKLTAENAYSELLALWGLEQSDSLSSGSEATNCGLPKNVPVHCLTIEGNWNSFLNLDRPAVVRLTLDGEISAFVTVSGLTNKDILFRTQGEERAFPRWAVRMHWDDEYRVLWKLPVPLKTGMRAGDTDEDSVAWLRTRLAETLDIDLEPERSPALFDEKLEDALRTFQKNKGLTVDGMLSKETLFQLLAVSPAQAGPRLKRGS